MLSANKKLRKRKDIEKLFKESFSCYGEHLGVKAVPNVLTHLRVLVVVSKKVSKLAVKRNKIKRQILAIIYSKQDRIKNFDLAIIVNPSSKNFNFTDLDKSLDYCFKKLKLYV